MKLEKKVNAVRFVGGCVRKALCGENVDDIDLATTLVPDEVKKILNKEDIKVIDTGISHGTVTAILNKKRFEITTLRKDISTDGRHANVEFTSNWKQDALSTRFYNKCNIRADIEGRIFDPSKWNIRFSKWKNKIYWFSENKEYKKIIYVFYDTSDFLCSIAKLSHDQDVVRFY